MSILLELIVFVYCFFPFQAYRGGDQNLWRRKHHNLIKCLDIRLKTVVLNNYRGIKSQVNFATFFVLNAKMLESMTFECQSYIVTGRFVAEQHRCSSWRKGLQDVLGFILLVKDVTTTLCILIMSMICLKLIPLNVKKEG